MFLRIAYLLLLTVSLSAQSIRPQLNGLESRKGQMILAAQTEAQTALAQANAQLKQAQGAFVAAKPGTILRATTAQSQAEHRQAQAQLRVTQLAAQLADWETTTLQVHATDAAHSKIDWAHGQIVAR